MTDPARLYEEDWYAWTQNQAALLRAWPPELRPNALDLEHIAEEIEDLGKERRSQVLGLLRRLIEHLLKLEFVAMPDSGRHWRAEVIAFREDLADRLNREDEPTLWSRREEFYRSEWPRALRLFTTRLAIEGAERKEILAELSPTEPRYDLDAEILNPDWYPAARAA